MCADDLDTRLLRAMVIKGILEQITTSTVNLVNADLLAKNRGLRIRETFVFAEGKVGLLTATALSEWHELPPLAIKRVSLWRRYLKRNAMLWSHACILRLDQYMGAVSSLHGGRRLKGGLSISFLP